MLKENCDTRHQLIDFSELKRTGAAWTRAVKLTGRLTAGLVPPRRRNISGGGEAAHLEANVVADQDVALHEVLLVLPVFCDHGEGVVDGGPQDADQRLDPGVGVNEGQVGLHDVAGRQPADRAEGQDV